MKLFDTMPIAIRTFGHRIKQFLTTCNTEVLDILETPSYFGLSPWCIKASKTVLYLVDLKKDRSYASIYKRLFMEIRDGDRDYIPVNIEGSLDGHFLGCATNVSMRFPDSASIFTAESLKPWNKLKILLSPYLLFLQINFRVSTHYSL